MPALGFLNPFLLWAMPLAAVPIIIHLLNKRRFQKVRWAAMEYLMRAMKRNRRRLRMEHFLILLLRTLAVIFLVLLITRPQLTGGGLIGVRTHHVVLLDDSASMAQRSGATNLYDQARTRVRGLIEHLVRQNEGDIFSLIRSSSINEPDLFGERIGVRMTARTGEILAAHPVGDGIMELGAFIEAALRRAKTVEEAGRTEFYLFSDFRQHDWLTADGKSRAEVVAQLTALDPETEHLTVQPLGSESANLSVAAVLRRDRVTVVGVPTTLTVEVVNQGLDASRPTELAVEIDGKSQVTRTVEPLAPGQKVAIDFGHTFHTPGFHGVVASLPTDRFPVDDKAGLALQVLDRSLVLLVDGDPRDEPEEAETYYLAAALDPGGETPSGIEARVVHDDNLPDVTLSEYGMVWLCNVTAPDEKTIAELEDYAAKGGGVVFFLGNQIDPAVYNERLFRDGEGLLPASVLDVSGDPDRPEPAFLANKTHPLVVDRPEFYELVLSRMTLVSRYMGMAIDPRVPASVLIRHKDSEGSPILALRTFKEGGTIALCGLTADMHWSGFPITPGFQLLMMELHKQGVRQHDLSAFNLGTQGVFRYALDQGLYESNVFVRARDQSGDEHTYTALPPEETDEGADPNRAQLTELTIPMGELAGFGVFDLVLTGHGGALETILFSRNPPVTEGRMARVTRGLLKDTYPSAIRDRVTFLAEESEGTIAREGEGEIWRLLAVALLAGLLLESFLAWRFGRR